jgi:hypothetical protein
MLMHLPEGTATVRSVKSEFRQTDGRRRNDGEPEPDRCPGGRR